MEKTTLFIWDECGERPISFFTLEGDYSRFDRVYVNAASGNQTLMDELNDLVYNAEGHLNFELSEKFPTNKFDIVVVCGFLP